MSNLSFSLHLQAISHFEIFNKHIYALLIFQDISLLKVWSVKNHYSPQSYPLSLNPFGLRLSQVESLSFTMLLSSEPSLRAWFSFVIIYLAPHNFRSNLGERPRIYLSTHAQNLIVGWPCAGLLDLSSQFVNDTVPARRCSGTHKDQF